MSTDFDFPGFADDFEPPPEGAYDEVPIDDPAPLLILASLRRPNLPVHSVRRWKRS
ncbi:hypothetical protein GCM10020255_012340 [Rhodococcus baikonurensis]